MNYIVLDLEFNQPFDFKTGKKTTVNPECPFEIIQIGAVRLNNDFEIDGSFNCYIKPKIYRRLHPFVEKITGITSETLNTGSSFEEAYRLFLDFCGNDPMACILCTWGVDDIKSLFKNILFYNLDAEALSHKFIDVQTYATKKLDYGPGKSIGLKNAVDELGLEINQSFHNALNDAEYTAKIFRMVRPEKLDYNSFNILDLARKNIGSSRIDTRALMAHFEARLGHKPDENEEKLIKSAYKLGRNQAFDIYGKK